MKFQDRLRELRTERGLTQQDVADVLNVTRATIAGYETAGKEPGHEKLKILADLFNVSIDYLVGYSDCRKSIRDEAELTLEDKKEISDKLKELYDELDSGEMLMLYADSPTPLDDDTKEKLKDALAYAVQVAKIKQKQDILKKKMDSLNFSD